MKVFKRTSLRSWLTDLVRARAFWVGCLGLGMLHASCDDDEDDLKGSAGSVSTAGAAGAAPSVAGAEATEAGSGPRAVAGAPGTAGEPGDGGRAGSVSGDAGAGGASVAGGAGGEGGYETRTDCIGAREEEPCPMYLIGPDSRNSCIDGDRACVCDSVGFEYYDSGWKCFPIGCPASEPHGGCTTIDPNEEPIECSYGSTVCLCRAGVGRVDSWHCFVPLACPPSAPTPGEPCTPTIHVPAPYERCRYGSQECLCHPSAGTSDLSTWQCYDG